MDRRDFLKLAGAVGLAVSMPATWTDQAAADPAANAPYDGTFFVTVDAGGGLDSTMLCDPRGGAGINPSFSESAIEEVGPFRYAPLGYNATFFARRASQLTVINGIDTGTNSHDVGKRVSWSGSNRGGMPSFAAMVAAQHAATAPMAYLSNGGYDATAGIVARTRSGTPSALLSIAYPNRPATSQPSRLYHDQATAERISDAHLARLQRQLDAQSLPAVSTAMNRLYAARTGSEVFAQLTEHVPATLDASTNPLKRQAQIAIAAYKAGIAASANLFLGGFDTHADHDARHLPLLHQLMEGVDFLLDEAERQGVAHKVFVMIASDFGRTPYYNSGGGKDHWPVTSVLLLGAGVSGNRVIGATDAGLQAMHLDPTTLAAVPASTPDSVKLTPGHVHRALRTMAGIGTPLDEAWPLEVELGLALL